MTVNEYFVSAVAGLTYEEQRKLQAHLLGGLVQLVDMGRKISKREAFAAIDRARADALRERVAASC